MIKPFKVLSAVYNEKEKFTGVEFEVVKSTRNGDTGFRTQKMKTYAAVPDGEDIDMFLFKMLEKSGWI